MRLITLKASPNRPRHLTSHGRSEHMKLSPNCKDGPVVTPFPDRPPDLTLVTVFVLQYTVQYPPSFRKVCKVRRLTFSRCGDQEIQGHFLEIVDVRISHFKPQLSLRCPSEGGDTQSTYTVAERYIKYELRFQCIESH
jgi:hypothetical protein